ncbi:MAG TPA: PilZ domain-containing protein [Pseudobdellovibrionaceae bacterium]|nr:PilZ domain-containing protein [Pseudobdellovibrionaceae bacterium]
MLMRISGRYARRSSDQTDIKVMQSNVSLARGIWLNMSQGGLLISLPSFADRLPNSFEITFKLPGSQKTITALVRLVWFKVSLKNILAGVEFIESDSSFRSTILKAVLKLKASEMLIKRGITMEHIFWTITVGIFFFFIVKKNL